MIDAPESLQLFVRSLGYVLHDLGQIELGRLSSDEGLMAGLAALKFVIEANVPSEVLYRILAALPQDDESYKIAVLTYIIRTYHLERSALETTLRAAQPESWEAMMGTIGEILSREARQEGLQVGRAEERPRRLRVRPRVRPGVRPGVRPRDWPGAWSVCWSAGSAPCLRISRRGSRERSLRRLSVGSTRRSMRPRLRMSSVPTARSEEGTRNPDHARGRPANHFSAVASSGNILDSFIRLMPSRWCFPGALCAISYPPLGHY